MLNKFPYVFWFKVSVRTNWFSYWWHTRGANSIEIQAWIFKISIGRPWCKGVLAGYKRDFKNLDQPKRVNDDNLKANFTILIGKYNP